MRYHAALYSSCCTRQYTAAGVARSVLPSGSSSVALSGPSGMTFAVRGFLDSSFQYTAEDKRRVREKIEGMLRDGAKLDARVASRVDELTTSWINDASTASGLANPFPQWANDLHSQAKPYVPAAYHQSVERLITGAKAKREMEMLQEAMLRKLASKLYRDAAAEKLSKAVADLSAHVRLIPSIDSMNLDDPRTIELFKRKQQLEAAVTDAKAKEIIVQACTEVQEDMMRVRDEDSSAFRFVIFSVQQAWAVFTFAAGIILSWFYLATRYARGRSPNQRFDVIDARLDALATDLAAASAQRAEAPISDDPATQADLGGPAANVKRHRRRFRHRHATRHVADRDISVGAAARVFMRAVWRALAGTFDKLCYPFRRLLGAKPRVVAIGEPERHDAVEATELASIA
jgi:hypothetical protein